jgi:hypothetical protein
MQHILLALGVLFVFGLAGALRAAPRVGTAAAGTEGGPSRHASIDQSFGKMPPYFVENRGQLDGRVDCADPGCVGVVLCPENTPSRWE